MEKESSAKPEHSKVRNINISASSWYSSHCQVEQELLLCQGSHDSESRATKSDGLSRLGESCDDWGRDHDSESRATIVTLVLLDFEFCIDGILVVTA